MQKKRSQEREREQQQQRVLEAGARVQSKESTSPFHARPMPDFPKSHEANPVRGVPMSPRADRPMQVSCEHMGV